MMNTIERRECSRTGYVAKVTVSSDIREIEIEAQMQDISIIGMYVETFDPLPPGTECEIRIDIAGYNSRLILEKIAAEVVRMTNSGMAVRFKTNMEWFVLFNIYTHYSQEGKISWKEGDPERRKENKLRPGSLLDRRKKH